MTSIECLGHMYESKTQTHKLSISLPTLRDNWQEGLLDPPTWSYREFRDPKQNAELTDERFDWGVTVGFHNEPDGTQSPDFARIRRWRFETTINTTNYASDFFAKRAVAVRELEAWWELVSSWISVFTRQDFVEIGKTHNGIRVGPIITWSGGTDGYRVNGSIDKSIPVVSDQVEILDHRTLTACMAHAANGSQPPDAWLFIRDARSLVSARQYRRAVIDAGTAAELAIIALVDPTLASMNFLEREKLYEKNRGLWELSNLMVTQSAGTRPARLQQDLAEPRNRAAHEGAVLNEAKANAAIAVAVALVEQLHPLEDLIASAPST
ncbi:hypothetical protein [Mycolicibacterium iranicum]|nr:hypothetical protein [Mycolicibacterium iranicum]